MAGEEFTTLRGLAFAMPRGLEDSSQATQTSHDFFEIPISDSLQEAARGSRLRGLLLPILSCGRSRAEHVLGQFGLGPFFLRSRVGIRTKDVGR